MFLLLYKALMSPSVGGVFTFNLTLYNRPVKQPIDSEKRWRTCGTPYHTFRFITKRLSRWDFLCIAVNFRTNFLLHFSGIASGFLRKCGYLLRKFGQLSRRSLEHVPKQVSSCTKLSVHNT